MLTNFEDIKHKFEILFLKLLKSITRPRTTNDERTELISGIELQNEQSLVRLHDGINV